jgi:GNAT superfamily N-acetyltransferase
MIVEALDATDYEATIPRLSELVVDAVDAGASINFLAGATTADAAGWWLARCDEIERGATTLFVARDDTRPDRPIVGCTLLMRSTNQNSPHRAEIGKVIVHTSARRQGLGSALMAAAEDAARAEGRWMLVLDTVTGSPADALYRSLGWHETGTVPDYALLPDGTPGPATFFWKDLR